MDPLHHVNGQEKSRHRDLQAHPESCDGSICERQSGDGREEQGEVPKMRRSEAGDTGSDRASRMIGSQWAPGRRHAIPQSHTQEGRP